MSVGHRSTTLQGVADHCSHWLDFYEAGAPYDRSVFGVGTSCHACLEECGKASVLAGRPLFLEEFEPVLHRTTDQLITTGRDFEGDLEPPLSPDVVYAGRDLALRFLAAYPISNEGEYEIGLAVNKDWMPCPYGSGAYLRARIDRKSKAMPGLLDDFDEGPTLEIWDFKTSWAERGALTLQRKIQAVLAWDRWGADFDALTVYTIAVRTATAYPIHIYPRTPEGAALLERWRADIDAAIHALDRMKVNGQRPASPGPQCMGCPYLAQCGPAREAASAVYSSDDPKTLARAYAVHMAWVDAFEPLLREATKEAPIDLGEEGVVGSVAKEQKVLGENAPAILAAAWNRKTHPDSIAAAQALVEGLIMRLDISRTNANKLLTHLYAGGAEERAMRQKVLGQITTTRTVRRFGLHGKGGDESEE